jgi:hypothetical protein
VGTDPRFETTASGRPYGGFLVFGGIALPFDRVDLSFDKFQPLIFSLEFMTQSLGKVTTFCGDLLLPKTLKGMILVSQTTPNRVK